MPTSYSSCDPATCVSPAGTSSSMITPVAGPVPGLDTVMPTVNASPIRTLGGAVCSTASCGRVEIERLVAATAKLTCAVLPISPSLCGITCSVICVSSPGCIVPRFHTSEPSAACCGCGLASTSCVPVGT